MNLWDYHVNGSVNGKVVHSGSNGIWNVNEHKVKFSEWGPNGHMEGEFVIPVQIVNVNDVINYVMETYPRFGNYIKMSRPSQTTAIFCTYCGAKLRPDSAFCAFCGSKVLSIAKPVPVSRPQPRQVYPYNYSKDMEDAPIKLVYASPESMTKRKTETMQNTEELDDIWVIADMSGVSPAEMSTVYDSPALSNKSSAVSDDTIQMMGVVYASPEVWIDDDNNGIEPGIDYDDL